MDDFEKAVLFSFDQTGAVDLGLKARAQSYLDDIRRNPDSWRLCLARFPTSGYVEVKFWCLQTLQESIKVRYTSQPPNARLQIKQTLMEWLRQMSSADLQPFLRNKFAQIIVSIVQIEYPSDWPSFFHDLLGMLSEGPALVDMFCRIMTAVDEDVISLEINRPQEEVKQSMQLKDAMRETCIKDVANAWTGLVAAYHSVNPELTASVLAVVERYVSWIDISLVANDKFMPLLFSVMGTSSEQLRGAVVDVVTEVVSKRMEPVPKLALIQGLGIIPTCCQWASSPPYQEDQSELGQKFARLLTALATELLESWKKVDNQVTSLQAVGLAVNAEAAKEATTACDAAQRLLDDLFPAILATLRSPVEGVSVIISPFLLAYVNKLKRSSSLTQPMVRNLEATMEGLASCASFPSEAALLGDSDQDDDGAVGSAATLDEDDEVAHLSRRTELFTVFRNIVKLMPEQAYSFVEAQLQGIVGQSSAAYQDVEVAISLLYQLGEGASEDALKADTGAVGRLALGLMQVDIPCTPHRLVAISLMEAYMRYARVLQSEPGQACLPRVLGIFLGSCGIGHPDEGVSTRACYLFSRLVKQVRGNLVARPGLIHSILTSLQPHLATIATDPPAGTGAQKTPSAVRPHHAGETSATDDRLYTFEAVGQLLGQEEVDAEEQLAYMSALLQPLLSQIDSNLPRSGTVLNGGAAAGGAEERPALLVMQALEAITRISKGLPSALVTRTRPKLGALLMEATEKAQRIPQLLPGSKPLRARYISFLHRMVEVLGSSMMAYFPPALEALMQPGADAQDMCEVIILLNQLIIRFKAALQPLLLKALPVCLKLVHALLPSDWDWSGRSFTPAAATAGSRPAGAASGSTEDSRERSELQRTYYVLLHTLSYNGLSSILVQTQPPLLDTALEALVRGAASHVEPATRRTCVQVLRQLVTNMEVSAGSRQYLQQRVAGDVCIKGLFQGELDARDASTATLLLDVAQLLKLLYEKCGDELLTYLGRDVLPSLGAAPSLQEQLAQHVRSSDAKQLKNWLRDIMQQASGLPVRSSAASRQKAMAASSANGAMLS